MTRWGAVLRLDARLQFRYGFFYAGVFVTVVSLAILRLISAENLTIVLPAFLLGQPLTTTFYFVAGLVSLEKSEGTLEALIVTPLGSGEYLASKVVTLTFLAVAECLVIVLATYGFGADLLLLVPGMVLLSMFYTLVGFVIISRYDSITEYLLPSVPYTLVLTLPLIDYFELWPHAVWYLIPTQAPLLLMKAAFQPIENWQMVYAVSYSLLTVAIGYRWATKTFHRFVVRSEGSR